VVTEAAEVFSAVFDLSAFFESLLSLLSFAVAVASFIVVAVSFESLSFDVSLSFPVSLSFASLSFVSLSFVVELSFVSLEVSLELSFPVPLVELLASLLSAVLLDPAAAARVLLLSAPLSLFLLSLPPASLFEALESADFSRSFPVFEAESLSFAADASPLEEASVAAFTAFDVVEWLAEFALSFVLADSFVELTPRAFATFAVVRFDSGCESWFSISRYFLPPCFFDCAAVVFCF